MKRMAPTKIAETVLHDLEQGHTLPTDLLALVADTPNLELEHFTTTDRFDGRLELRRNTPTIFLNLHERDLQHPRVRFTLAHELGHFFLHRQHLRRGHAFHDSALTHGEELPAVEREANEFASGLLLPESLVKRFLDGTSLSLEIVVDLAGLANTSYEATAIRLSNVCWSRFCFFWERDGKIQWTSPSHAWVHARHPWRSWKSKPVPNGSAARERTGDVDSRTVCRSVWQPTARPDDTPFLESAVHTPFGRLIMVTESGNVAPEDG